MSLNAFFLTFIGIVCAFVLQIETSEAECHTSLWGTQLVNHVMDTLAIGDIDSCYMTCAATPGCQSINYYTERSLCELNSRTIENTPNMREANEDSVYFTILDPIPLRPVDGNFTEWSNWTQCLLPTCGQRKTRHRDRSCTNPPPAHGGKNCTGPYSETQNCTLTQMACPIFKNCTEFYERGFNRSGVYSIDPDGDGEFEVYCDHMTAGGGWTVFQRRKDGSVDFYRGWNDYKRGFGNLEGEFWLGLDKIYRLTRQTKNRLRVDLEDFEGQSAYAEYDYFAVASEENKYRLSLGTYSGTAGDAFSYHKDNRFSTKDRDNDKARYLNCAEDRKGAWWYNYCSVSNLNGLYTHDAKYYGKDSVNWSKWRLLYAVKRAEMKIRPV